MKLKTVDDVINELNDYAGLEFKRLPNNNGKDRALAQYLALLHNRIEELEIKVRQLTRKVETNGYHRLSDL